MSVVTARELTRTFGSAGNLHYALRDVNLDVKQGEILMLIGPSGSGKTTLLSIMGGILRPSSGSISVGGVELSGLSQRRLSEVRLANIGFIFQEYNLFPTLTAQQNVMVSLDLQGYSGREAKAAAAKQLEVVGLGDRLGSYPSQMSGGQKQRLAIARALAGEPQVLLADEPTAALDSENGLLIMGLLSQLAHEQGRAVVIVTHDNRIVPHADRVARIEDGRLYPDSGASASVPPDTTSQEAHT